jgi:hypothetical protein
VSKNKKKGQVIKTSTLKRKVKCHCITRDDGISVNDKGQKKLFVIIFCKQVFCCFPSPKSFVEKLQRQCKEKLQKLRE